MIRIRFWDFIENGVSFRGQAQYWNLLVKGHFEGPRICLVVIHIAFPIKEI